MKYDHDITPRPLTLGGRTKVKFEMELTPTEFQFIKGHCLMRIDIYILIVSLEGESLLTVLLIKRLFVESRIRFSMRDMALTAHASMLFLFKVRTLGDMVVYLKLYHPVKILVSNRYTFKPPSCDVMPLFMESMTSRW